ncbi:class I SAM-dependent methyltransferase [Hymenobacter nivis]|uniref:Methyltransferase domain-containing protein n=1 Tax=Hymenobacter nivis TaxID=1850093 RepID=A0A502HFS4_9BACT|nr:methyltransferase domain-containing protein [Hymenobacter nivis]TPG72098.1 methyltransferase domain-containing protein [Hymenobacter nivis]
MELFRPVLLPSKFRFIERFYGQKPFRLLDIGAGNHSASNTKKWFPACEYHGVDLDKNYHNDENDFRLMTAFYEMNLEALDFAAIPDNYFDFIVMAHVVEHLKNGDDVIAGLLPKLRKGGLIYLEFPGYHSTTLPRMQGTLNFFDDDTHVRIYSLQEFYNLFLRHQFQVVAGGVQRRWHNILLIPLKIPHNLIKYKRIVPSIFWDLLGFAEYVVARKK